MVTGRRDLEVFLLLVVRMMDSFLPTILASKPTTCLLAMLLNLNLLRPHMFPGSAVSTGKLLDFRMKEELFLTHSHMRSGDADAILWNLNLKAGGLRWGLVLGLLEPNGLSQT
mmetsp:Transcript_50741/g.91379  ORF Transcript_50741/g.91379 Transcript_50741/m.91379 type:complete len:113 (+) Transcript_50741:259-597(+)